MSKKSNLFKNMGVFLVTCIVGFVFMLIVVGAIFLSLGVD